MAPVRWALLAPEKKFKISIDPAGRPFPVLCRKPTFDAWALLMHPLQLEPINITSIPIPGRSLDVHEIHKAGGYLAHLPAELLSDILRRLEVEDLVNLGITCRYHWNQLLEQIRVYTRNHPIERGPLAGTKIACCSSDATNLPDQFQQNNFLRNAVARSALEVDHNLDARATIAAGLDRHFPRIKIQTFYSKL